MAIPRYAVRHRSIVSPALLAAALIWSAPAAGSEPPPLLDAVGGRETAWVYLRSGEAPADQRVWQFAYRTPNIDRRIGWLRPRQWGPVPGQIGATAVRGQRLHVIFEDGTHRLYTTKRASIALKLPRPVVPLAMAGDDERNTVYALVAKHVADLLKGETESDSTAANENASAAPDDTTTTAEGAGEPGGAPEVAEPDEPIDRWPGSNYVLLRHQSGRWHPDRGLPTWVDQPTAIWLTASNELIEILAALPQDPAVLWYARSRSVQAPWSNRSAIDGVGAEEVIDVLRAPKGMTLVRRRADAAVSFVHRADDAWIEDPKLTIKGVKFSSPPGGAAFTSCGERVLAVWMGENATPQWAEWNVGGGEASAGPLPLLALVADRALHAAKQANRLITCIALGVILATLVIRRRGGLSTPIPLKPPYHVAGFARRLGAFAIDWLLLAPAIAYTYQPILPHSDVVSLPLLQAHMMNPDVVREMMWRWAMVLAAFGLYASIFEIWWGATPGKRLLKCRVLSESAEPCGAGRVLLRNACRILEMYPYFALIWTLMLVLLTRNRQRLGDLVARTVVVEQRAAAP